DSLEWSDAAKDVLQGETVPTVIDAFERQLQELDVFEASVIQKAVKAVQKETGVKGKNLFMPIRVATTGQQHGPQLNDAIELLGKEKALNNIAKAKELMN